MPPPCSPRADDAAPWQLWTLDGQPVPGTLELVTVLESVLKRHPDHPGANHFYIHAVEASPNLERAIPSAMRLMTLVPGAGHLVHMPGHIFLQTGDYDLAAQTNVNAAAADQAFVQRTGATGMYPLMYWTHNMHFIAYAGLSRAGTMRPSRPRWTWSRMSATRTWGCRCSKASTSIR